MSDRAENGATGPASEPAVGHHIGTSGAMLAVPSSDWYTPEEPPFLAQWYLWACGPCQVQGAGAGPGERDAQIAEHLGGPTVALETRMISADEDAVSIADILAPRRGGYRGGWKP